MLSFDAFPARPPSEMEWEDLLVRYELAPRALHVALSEGSGPGERAPSVVAPLMRLVSREAWSERALAALRSGGPVPGYRGEDVGPGHARVLAEDFALLRARNFAAVQRRGIDVWEWSAVIEGEGRVSAYQLLMSAVSLDGQTLAQLRAALREGGG